MSYQSTFHAAYTAESLYVKAVPFIIFNFLIYIAVEDLPAFMAETAAEGVIIITESIFRADFPQFFHVRGASVPAENTSDISP